MPKHRDHTVNPPHNVIHHEPPEVTKARAFEYHKRAGSLGDYYLMYPGDRPPSREPRDGGRSR